MQRTAVINVVGLTSGLIGEHTPQIAAFVEKGSLSHIRPSLPAVTCTAQSNYLTGKQPSDHGIVANGWYSRELAETQFWKQPDQVVQSPKIWHRLKEKDSSFTCAKMFWWYNMYSEVDYSITPRPMYPSDGRKFFDIYSWPYSIREEIKKDLGEFPFFGFWGPAAGVDSPQGKADCVSRWIADSAKWIEEKKSPTLNLIYLPHLDYNLQRFGPNDSRIAKDLREIDTIVGDLIGFFEKRFINVVLLSEYGITEVSNPIHLNREFRKRGWLTIKEELGRELIDYGASKVIAVADHQLAHVYLNDKSIESDVTELLNGLNGVGEVLSSESLADKGLAHERSGDIVVVSQEDSWFTYYYWLDDNKAPDYARCVDIHRKPGYDPVELFLDPRRPVVKLQILWRLLKKKLGFRMLMDVIPLDASLVKGSHGAVPASREDWPVLIETHSGASREELDSTEVQELLFQVVMTKS